MKVLAESAETSQNSCMVSLLRRKGTEPERGVILFETRRQGRPKNKMERQPYPPYGSCVAKNSQRPVSVETVQGGVPPYGVKETLVVNGKW